MAITDRSSTHHACIDPGERKTQTNRRNAATLARQTLTATNQHRTHPTAMRHATLHRLPQYGRVEKWVQAGDKRLRDLERNPEQEHSHKVSAVFNRQHLQSQRLAVKLKRIM
jgi:hypothetical protein